MLSREFSGRAAFVGYALVGMGCTATCLPASAKIASANSDQAHVPSLVA